MRYLVTHRTRYDYEAEVPLSRHQARLTPRACVGQRCLEHELIVEPSPAALERRVDYFGNPTVAFTVEMPHQRLLITARSLIERSLTAPASVDPTPWEAARDLWRSPTLEVALAAGEFCFDSPLVARGQAFAAYALPSFAPGRPFLEAVLDLTSRIHADFRFAPSSTTVATPLERVLQERRGVCQDFAHLHIACLRSLGLAARYVSGYLETEPPPGKARLIGADASHAWIAVFCPGLGWVELDPTNDVAPSTRHLTLAWGRDYTDVSPLRGILVGSGGHRLTVAVDVERVEESGQHHSSAPGDAGQ